MIAKKTTFFSTLLIICFCFEISAQHKEFVSQSIDIKESTLSHINADIVQFIQNKGQSCTTINKLTGSHIEKEQHNGLPNDHADDISGCMLSSLVTDRITISKEKQSIDDLEVELLGLNGKILKYESLA